MFVIGLLFLSALLADTEKPITRSVEKHAQKILFHKPAPQNDGAGKPTVSVKPSWLTQTKIASTIDAVALIYAAYRIAFLYAHAHEKGFIEEYAGQWIPSFMMRLPRQCTFALNACEEIVEIYLVKFVVKLLAESYAGNPLSNLLMRIRSAFTYCLP